jgi:head-tail adaptor
MRAGDLRDRIRIERLVASQWALVAVVWASVRPGGTANIQGTLIPELPVASPSTAYEVRIRYRTDIAEDMRVRWGTRTLTVASALDPDDRRRELALQCATSIVYADYHAQLLVAMATEGAPLVTFTKAVTTSRYDAETNTLDTPPVTTTATGYIKRIGGEPQQRETQSLVEREAPTVLFVPTTYGTLPALGASAHVSADDFFLRSVLPIAPDGVALAARLVVDR